MVQNPCHCCMSLNCICSCSVQNCKIGDWSIIKKWEIKIKSWKEKERLATDFGKAFDTMTHSNQIQGYICNQDGLIGSTILNICLPTFWIGIREAVEYEEDDDTSVLSAKEHWHSVQVVLTDDGVLRFSILTFDDGAKREGSTEHLHCIEVELEKKT